jgi:hypothetical protein
MKLVLATTFLAACSAVLAERQDRNLLSLRFSENASVKSSVERDTAEADPFVETKRKLQELQCFPFTIDFKQFLAGDEPFDLCFGITVTAEGRDANGDPTGNGAMIFDSGNPTGGDSDLGGDYGMVMIISEDGDASDPDDNLWGGRITFDFDFEVPAFVNFVDTMKILDIDDSSRGVSFVNVSVIEGDSNQDFAFALAEGSNGNLQEVDFDAIIDQEVYNVKRVSVDFAGSGAVVNLAVQICCVGEGCNELCDEECGGECEVCT